MEFSLNDLTSICPDRKLPHSVITTLVNQRNPKDLIVFLAIVYRMDSHGEYMNPGRTPFVYNRVTWPEFTRAIKRLERAGLLKILPPYRRGSRFVRVVNHKQYEVCHAQG